jgi:hypothetical protein
MDAEESTVRAQFLGGHSEINRLQQRAGCCSSLGLRRRSPMAEGEEADLFHDSLK